MRREPVCEAVAGLSSAAGSLWLPRELCARFVLFCIGGSSIGSLLAYLYGVTSLATAFKFLVIPSAVLVIAVFALGNPFQSSRVISLFLRSLWPGVLATAAYDLVRVPAALSSVPVFKAISYFGTVLIGMPAPSGLSEIIGWSFHLTNGIGFGLMYFCLFRNPKWWTGVSWGLLLELVMLGTPYAEVFGYRLSKGFLCLTATAHATYGLTLWLAGFPGCTASVLFRSPLVKAIRWILPLGTIFAIAINSHARWAVALPPSPPAYIGPHLYVTWDELEMDRVASTWVWQRFVDKQARYHFIPPYSQFSRGTPFDVPDAKVRRSATRSTTEVILAEHNLLADPKLAKVGQLTHLFEVAPWMASSDPEAQAFARQVQQAMDDGKILSPSASAQRAFAWLDRWYAAAETH